jgi:hypothetical protein
MTLTVLFSAHSTALTGGARHKRERQAQRPTEQLSAVLLLQKPVLSDTPRPNTCRERRSGAAVEQRLEGLRY